MSDIHIASNQSIIIPNNQEFFADLENNIIFKIILSDYTCKCIAEIILTNLYNNTISTQNIVVPGQSNISCLNEEECDCNKDKGFKKNNIYYITIKFNNLICGHKYRLNTKLSCIDTPLSENINQIINNIDFHRFKCCITSSPTPTPSITPEMSYTPTPTQTPSLTPGSTSTPTPTPTQNSTECLSINLSGAGESFNIVQNTTICGLNGVPGTTVSIGNNSLTLVASSNNNIFYGNLSGAGSFIKQGLGLFSFTDYSQSFEGSLIIEDGELDILNESNLDVIQFANSIIIKNNTTLGLQSGLNINNNQIIQGQGTIISGSSDCLFLLNGATISPGNNIGILTINGNVTWNGGAIYKWQIYDSDISYGDGWDYIHCYGSLNINADQSSPFIIRVESMSSPNANGPLYNFNSVRFIIAHFSNGIIGFDASKFIIDTTNFISTINGIFSIELGPDELDLYLVFTPA